MTIFSQQTYLQKHRFAPKQIKSTPSDQLGIAVVIPVYRETRLIQTLESLEQCQKPDCDVETILVVNAGTHASAETHQINENCIQQVQNWQKTAQKQFNYHILNFPSLARKHAGVGLARKIGMDEAVERFEQIENPDGIILCLDADTLVLPNYLIEVERHFRTHPKSWACSIYFEHPLDGDEFDERVYRAIVYYELYLRYYVEALRYAGHPYAFHTVGSAMAAKSFAYQRLGGMNRRKAGEDFYFLQKFIQEGRLTELNNTTVIPSPRPADNVPFGTGKSVIEWLQSGESNYKSYDFRIFEDLKIFLEKVPDLYDQPMTNMPKSISVFLEENDFESKLAEIRLHVTSQAAFVKRFFKWFNGLKVLQFVHFTRDHFYPNVEIEKCAQALYKGKYGSEIIFSEEENVSQKWLLTFREMALS